MLPEHHCSACVVTISDLSPKEYKILTQNSDTRAEAVGQLIY